MKAAFLDRDGTLMEDSGFVGDPRRIRVLDGVPEALRLLAAAGYACIVVTNQSGVARGYFGEPDVLAVHAELNRLLAEANARVDAYYYCVHLEGCDCRKPLPGLARQAIADRGIDAAQSVVFGDRATDIGLGAALDMPTVLVNAFGTYAGPEPTLRASSLLEGVRAYLAVVHA